MLGKFSHNFQEMTGNGSEFLRAFSNYSFVLLTVGFCLIIVCDRLVIMVYSEKCHCDLTYKTMNW